MNAMEYKKFCSISKAAGTGLLCACLLAGCTKTAPSELPDGEKETVVFGLAGLPEFAVSTKATAPATSVSSFKAAATTGTAGSETAADWNNVVFTTDGAAAPTYMASPAKYWPLSNPCYNFYAVAASEGSAQALATEAPDMSFTAEGAVISLPAGYDKDVVCAYFPYAENTYLQKNQLAFNHIFARIAGVSVKADDDCAISEVSVSIVDAKTGGEYNLRTGWSNPVPASGDIEIYQRTAAIASGESDATGSIFDDADGSLYLVPGSYQLKATWTATIDDYTQTYTAMSSKTALDFVGGKVNIIACKLTGDAEEIVFSVNVRDWTGNDLGNKVFPTENVVYATLSELKMAVGFDVDCSDYLGWYVLEDGTICTDDEAAPAGTIGRITYMSTSDVEVAVPGSRILVLATENVGGNTKYSWKTSYDGGPESNRYSSFGPGGSPPIPYPMDGLDFCREDYITTTYPAAYYAYHWDKQRPYGATEWFLPSYGQMDAMADAAGLPFTQYWTSSERLDTHQSAWYYNPYAGNIHNFQEMWKDDGVYFVRACFAY